MDEKNKGTPSTIEENSLQETPQEDNSGKRKIRRGAAAIAIVAAVAATSEIVDTTLLSHAAFSYILNFYTA